jgi:superoxide dismutase, Cu-Zn family
MKIKQILEQQVNLEAAGVGIVTKQNATSDVPVGGEYQNVKKLFPKKKEKQTESTCPRTKASKCQCESVKQITESQEEITASCVLEHGKNVSGTLLLKQKPGGPTFIAGKITGLEPGEHGFHIHEFGDLSNGCESAGAHYNPDGVDHGDLEQGHVGDLGNVTADENGVATVRIIAERVDLTGDRSVVGRAVVIHSDKDDLGKGGDAESLKTGNAGDRLACGVITLKETVNESLEEGCKYGTYYCSTDKKWKCRKGPKQSRTNENFADGKNPGRKGLSQRVGIPKGATIAQLEKAAEAGGEKGRLARWQLNMRRGRKKGK